MSDKDSRDGPGRKKPDLLADKLSGPTLSDEGESEQKLSARLRKLVQGADIKRMTEFAPGVWSHIFSEDPLFFEELIEVLMTQGEAAQDEESRKAVANALLVCVGAIDDYAYQEWIVDRLCWDLLGRWKSLPASVNRRLRLRFMPETDEVTDEVLLKVAPARLSVENNPDEAETWGFLAATLHLNNHAAEALAAVEEAISRRAEVLSYMSLRANCLIRLGRQDEAIDQLIAVCEQGSEESQDILKDAIYDPIREDPRFPG